MKGLLRNALIVCASIILGCVGQLQTASADLIFSDDFEGGLANWTANPTLLSLSNAKNIVPAGGNQSALITSSTNSMYQNIGQEVSGAFTVSFYIYDDGYDVNRGFTEIRAYSGAGYNDGSLQQLISAGINNAVSLPGDTWNATKYQGRIAFGTNVGWFNLDAAGSPNRSIGWHSFDIAWQDDGNVLFYVDGILGRAVGGATIATFDSLKIGSVGAGSFPYNLYVDGLSLSTPVPLPSALWLLGSGLVGLAAIRRRFRQ